jgi:hypothetical protein
MDLGKLAQLVIRPVVELIGFGWYGRSARPAARSQFLRSCFNGSYAQLPLVLVPTPGRMDRKRNPQSTGGSRWPARQPRSRLTAWKCTARRRRSVNDPSRS